MRPAVVGSPESSCMDQDYGRLAGHRTYIAGCTFLRMSRPVPDAYIGGMTWTELVLGASPVQGDQPAVSDVRTGEVLSYNAFARKVTHAAAGLRRHGLRYGDRVIVDMPLGGGFAMAVHSVAWSGGVAVLGDSGTARMMIAQRGYDPLAV